METPKPAKGVFSSFRVTRRYNSVKEACGECKSGRDKGVCAEIPGAKKPRGYWDRSPSRQRGKGGFPRGTTCSEQKGPTNLPASIRENTPSALSHRSPCVRGLRSW